MAQQRQRRRREPPELEVDDAAAAASADDPSGGDRKLQRQRERAARRRAGGLCPRDGRPVQPGLRQCHQCAEKSMRREQRRSRGRESGRCPRCWRFAAARDEPQFARAANGRLCTHCWFSATSLAHFGARRYGPALAALWLAQGGRCALTGVALTIGRDASLDHRVPRSRGGPRNLGNVRWVSYAANMLKGNLHDDELLAACARILAFAASPDRKRMDRALRRAVRIQERAIEEK